MRARIPDGRIASAPGQSFASSTAEGMGFAEWMGASALQEFYMRAPHTRCVFSDVAGSAICRTVRAAGGNSMAAAMSNSDTNTLCLRRSGRGAGVG